MLASWRQELVVDLVIANGENASGGNGLTVKNAQDLFGFGIDLITSGNHIWKQRDYLELFKQYPRVIRPANYPDELPGTGWAMVEAADTRVAVLNLQGQVFMEPIDNPFRTVDRILDEIRRSTPIVLVDFHAEATSERVAMGLHLDGRVSAVMGTHTHVPSADAGILAGGTAYRTDLGMVGPIDGVLGVETQAILRKFLTGLPSRFTVARGRVIATGAVLEIDPSDGKALKIEDFHKIYDPEIEEGTDDT
jgi:metallophosphoesterase (TIGR00282 family)